MCWLRASARTAFSFYKKLKREDKSGFCREIGRQKRTVKMLQVAFFENAERLAENPQFGGEKRSESQRERVLKHQGDRDV